MTYSDEVLTQIEQYASIYLKISDMAVILGVPPEALRRDIADRSTAVSQRYHRGRRHPVSSSCIKRCSLPTSVRHSP